VSIDRAYDFLLVVHGNLVSTLQCFWDTVLQLVIHYGLKPFAVFQFGYDSLNDNVRKRILANIRGSFPSTPASLHSAWPLKILKWRHRTLSESSDLERNKLLVNKGLLYYRPFSLGVIVCKHNSPSKYDKSISY